MVSCYAFDVMKCQTKQNIIDLYFPDARAKLIDIAAFMDRTEKAGNTDDFRYMAFRKALQCLDTENRAEDVLFALSDPTKELITEAGTKSASGAWPGKA